MGTVVPFPFSKRSRNRLTASGRNGPAAVVILPVVRIERWNPNCRSTPSTAVAKSRRRQRAKPE